MNTLLNRIASVFVTRFWASPSDTFWIAPSLRDMRWERRMLKVLDPGFPRDDPPPERPGNPTQFPTDVPAPEPHDVPAPQPSDVPPPDPGKEPKQTKPPQRPKQDPKPRPIP